MRKLIVAGILVVALLGLLSAVAFSAPGDPSQDVTVNAAVAKAVWLVVTDSTVSLSGSPGIDTSSDKTAGFEVTANWGWTLQANAKASLGGFDAGLNPATLPGTSILVEGDPMSSNKVVASGVAKTMDQAVTVNYLQNFQWDDTAGDYSDSHTYTLAFN